MNGAGVTNLQPGSVASNLVVQNLAVAQLTVNGTGMFSNGLTLGAGATFTGNLSGGTNIQVLPVPVMINTSTGLVTYVLTQPQILIKTNATYNLQLVANNTTNVVIGDGIWIDVTQGGTNFYTRY
jgi:hypothetical protein